MDSVDKSQFDSLVMDIPNYVKKRKLEDEEIGLYYDADFQYCIWHYYDKDYFFDINDECIFDEIWGSNLLFVNKDGYLCIKDEKTNKKIGVHRALMLEEVNLKAEELKCPTGDVHVHHKVGVYGSNKCDNTRKNLQVVHKDEHALIHGFRNWKEYQNWLRRHGKKDFY